MAYKPFTSIKEIHRALDKWEPSWGNRLSTLVVIYACEKLEEIAARLEKPARPHRKASKWNKFFARGMKAGKSPKQIGKEWKAMPNG